MKSLQEQPARQRFSDVQTLIDQPLRSSSLTTRIALVESDLLLRELLAEVISAIDGLMYVGGWGSLAAAQDYLRSAASPDILILDLILPDGRGWELLSEQAVVDQRTRVVFASGHVSDRSLMYFVRHRIMGYIDKSTTSVHGWEEALTNLAKGRKYVSPAIAAAAAVILADPLHWSRLLTDREFDAITLLGSGCSNSEVARDLGLSESTAQVYRKRIMRKLGIGSTRELMRWALGTGLVS